MHKVRSKFINIDLLGTLISIIYQKVLDVLVRTLIFVVLSVQSVSKVIMSFIIVYYLWLPVLLVPFALLLLYRSLITLIFKVVFRGKYKLMDAADAAHAFDSYANVNTITFFLYINGPCDMDELQARVEKLFLQYSRRTGQRPYWKLLMLAREKLGFMCWEDLSSSFDVERHVRNFPGFDQKKQVYREADLFEAVSELSCKEWDCTKPKWEFLITPQLKSEVDNSIYSVITIRISHEYGDGISIMQMFRKHIFDKPVPKISFDPVNPPIPKVSFSAKLFRYLQVLLLGPSCIRKLLSYNDSENVEDIRSLTGPKFFGRNTVGIPLEIIRKIRRHFRVSTSAIFHSAFCGALSTMAERSEQNVPLTVIGGMAYGLFPYPNDNLQNHFTTLVVEYPVFIEDPVERVRQIEKRLRRVVQPYSLITTSLTHNLMGLLPAKAVKAALGISNILFVVSNVPGFAGDVRFGGYPVHCIFGSSPSCKGIKFTLGVGCYEGQFNVGFFTDKSTIVQSKVDLEALIKVFEDEIYTLSSKM